MLTIFRLVSHFVCFMYFIILYLLVSKGFPLAKLFFPFYFLLFFFPPLSSNVRCDVLLSFCRDSRLEFHSYYPIWTMPPHTQAQFANLHQILGKLLFNLPLHALVPYHGYSPCSTNQCTLRAMYGSRCGMGISYYACLT